MYNWEELNKILKDCRGCGLCDTRHNVVVGRGTETARILFVGEGPGEQEDLQGKPFVGPAGKLLDLVLQACRIKEEEYYIANIVKCRPPMNRDPLPEEAAACMPYLRNQFALIKPEAVICLGRIAAKSLVDPNIKITREHGQWVDKKGVRFMATFHPAAILHDAQGGNAKKKMLFDDMMKVRAFLDGKN